MRVRKSLILGSCLILSFSAAGDEPSVPRVSLLSCALPAAERTAVPAMLAETNLTSKSSQLETLTGLLSAAGRFDRALELVEEAQEPNRVLAPALAEIAIGALHAGDDKLADRIVARLSAMQAWTAPAAMTELAEVLFDAGRVGEAHDLILAIHDPGAKARALIDLARSSPPGSEEAEAWLRQAFDASRQIRPGLGHHIQVGNMREYLADYGERYRVLLDLAGAYAERGMIDSARDAVAAIDAVTDGKKAIWKARALLAVAAAPAAAGQKLELTAEALTTIESAFEMTVGDTREKVEILGEVARRFEDLGKPKQARQALALARSTAEKQKQVDEPRILASVGVETLALLAGAYADLGLNQQALAILDEAEVFVGPSWHPFSDSKLDPVPSRPHARVKALATIVARRERAGHAASANLDAELISGVADIGDATWRDAAWMDIATAYLDVGLPERALEILRAGKNESPDQGRAWNAVTESLLAADRLDDAMAIADDTEQPVVGLELLVKVADRLQGAGRERDAERLITGVLRKGFEILAAAGAPAAQDRLLLGLARAALAAESPFLTHPATAEQRQILARLGCGQ